MIGFIESRKGKEKILEIDSYSRLFLEERSHIKAKPHLEVMYSLSR